MPIFELDEGHPVLVQPMAPTAGSFAPDSSALLAEHLTSLFGEQLFPVRSRHGDAPGPDLLALDAAGQPVVVDVVQVLDAESLVRALQHAGTATRLSRTELLRTYEGGAETFDPDFRAFRDRVPLTAGQPAPVLGARLLLVCAEVDPQVVDAVAFLRQPGRQVEVLQLGVVRGADGRRYVDVSPLVLQPVRRVVEPASLRLVRSPGPVPEALAHDADRAARAPVPYRDPTPRSGHAYVATGQASFAAPRPTPAAPPAVRIPPAPLHPSGAHRPVTAPTPSPSTGVAPVGRAAHSAPSDLPWSSSADALPGPRALPALAALVKGRGAVATLVWFRERRGQRLLATLRHDGLIELPDGRVHASPDDAAADAANAEGTVDGWHVWRLGDGGPTLAQAAGVP